MASDAFYPGAPALDTCQPDTRQPDLARLRDRYFRFALERNPVTSTYLGGDGWDPALAEANGRLRDFRPSALREEVAFFKEIRRELAAIDVDGLGPRDRVDHAVLGAQTAFILHQDLDLRYFERAVDTYIVEPFRGIDWQIQQMADTREGFVGTDPEWRLVVARLRAVPEYLGVARENLSTGRRSGNMADRRMVEHDGVRGARANEEYFRTTLPALARRCLGSRASGGLLSDLVRAAASAANAYREAASFLEAQLPDSREDRFAIGESEYEWRVRNNLGDARTAQELWDHGGEQVGVYQDRIYSVAGAIGRANGLGLRFETPSERAASVRAVKRLLGLDAASDDDELLSWYIDTGRRAVEYGRQCELFDIPTDYRLDVAPTPPILRSTVEAAYYPASPFKGTGLGRFYLTPVGEDPAALALNNRASVAVTAVHEGFPGHDWHFRYMAQAASDISSIRWFTPGAVEDSSSMWEDSAAIEGWGLYAEELMSEPAPAHPHGFYTSGEFLYALLLGQLRRAVRVRVDVGLHTGRMSFSEAVDYQAANQEFVPDACRRAGSDPTAKAICAAAQRATYRYSKWPTQAITYSIGKSAILDLRDSYRRAKGNAFSARQFHERFMAMGTIPVAYFRDVFLAPG